MYIYQEKFLYVNKIVGNSIIFLIELVNNYVIFIFLIKVVIFMG